MAQGLDTMGHSSGEETQQKNDNEKRLPKAKIETDVKFLQSDKLTNNYDGVGGEDEIPENETIEMQTKQVCRIKMRFKLIVAKSTLPKKMPETIVYWNRCETRVNQETQSLVTQEQLQYFHAHYGVKLHDYPDAIAKVAKSFPLLDGK